MSLPPDRFTPLALSALKPHTGYSKPYFFSPNPVKVSSSALEVMTDLRFVQAATVHAEVDVMSAAQKMIARGVRLLLVVDAMDDVIGLITARDLMEDRPFEVMGSSGVELGEVKVAQVMTVADDIEVIPLDDVLHAHVGDIVETLKYSGRQHAMVIEDEPFTGKAVIRGIFSASQIARQLGVVLQKHDLSQTFAEIDRAMTDQTGQ
jgi:signal-transduction protein with cAMP-binding, CBS, and nucleotidyltransferase domain